MREGRFLQWRRRRRWWWYSATASKDLAISPVRGPARFGEIFTYVSRPRIIPRADDNRVAWESLDDLLISGAI